MKTKEYICKFCLRKPPRGYGSVICESCQKTFPDKEDGYKYNKFGIHIGWYIHKSLLYVLMNDL
jgi:hypothetical protein